MTPDFFYPIRILQTKTQDTDSRRGCVEPLTAFPTLVGQVFGNPTVPTSIGRYYSVHPVDVSGVENEGGAGTLASDPSRTFLVDVIGPQPAIAGEFLICRFLGNRWAADRMGNGQGQVVIVPGCPCSQSPVTISMHSSEPASNNQMFQSATLQYGPTPSNLLPVVLQTSSYLSTSSFPDPILGAPFYYLLNCYVGAYVLTRVYVTSPFGSPYRDAIRYSWVPGFSGNTCSPFLMTNGQIYRGGDPTCVVTLSQ
jgi:hypothetical protein